MQLDLFDHMVVSVLLRGSEIWGFDGNITIEKLHLKFCPMLPWVHNKTPKSMIYGELGRLPQWLQFNIDQNVLHFWAKILHVKDKQFAR